MLRGTLYFGVVGDGVCNDELADATSLVSS